MPGSTVAVGQGLTSMLPTGSTLATIAPALAVDLNGDGTPDTGVFGLGLKSSTLDATTRQGTVQLDGGFVVRAAGQDLVTLDDPEIVVGATSQTSGLYALVNGVRIRVGDIDPALLRLSVAGVTVTVSGLDVRVSTEGALALSTVPGLTGLTAGGQLLSLDLSVPQL
jgi:hypothetical protein